MTLAYTHLTFDPSNTLYSSQSFFLPNLVVVGHILGIFTCGWPGPYHPTEFRLDASQHRGMHKQTVTHWQTRYSVDRYQSIFECVAWVGLSSKYWAMLDNKWKRRDTHIYIGSNYRGVRHLVKKKYSEDVLQKMTQKDEG